MSSEWFVYILDCDGTHLYTGISTNVRKRLSEHRSGKAPGAKFTQRFKDIELVYSVKCFSKRQAQQIEYAIKKKSRQVKLDLIVKKPDLKRLTALLKSAPSVLFS